MAEHQRELQALAERDPSFYAHLQKSDRELLDFGDAPADRDAGAMAESVERTLEAQARADSVVEVTLLDVQALRRQVQAGSVRALTKIAKYFRAACHMNDEEQKEQERFKFANTKTYNALLRFCFRDLGSVFADHFSAAKAGPVAGAAAAGGEKGGEKGGKKGGKKGRRGARDEDAGAEEADEGADVLRLRSHPRWAKLGDVLRSYLGNWLHYLHACVEPGMTAFILSAGEDAMPLFAAFPKLAKRLLKELLQVQGQGQGQGTLAQV
jgi:hypothetical protein